MTAAEESNILVHAGEMAKHYAMLYNLCDNIKARDYYMDYIRSIAHMVNATDEHITMHYRVDISYPVHSMNIWRVYFRYDGEPFGIPWDIKE